jgi:glycerophosphoryl diester phosphodiesterase
MNIYDTWLVKSPIAHRGLFTDKIPENSIASLKNAIKNKCPVELDVTILVDGVVVVFHDEKLARMTGKDGFISNCSYADISKLTLAGTKEKIPTLKEALDAIDGKVPVLIEIKNYGKVGVIEKAVWKVLQDYRGEYAIQSFNPYTLEWFKNNAPKIKRGQLASFFKNKEITGIKRFYLKRMLLNKKISEPNFISYSAEDMPNKYVKKYYGVIPVLAWGIDSEEKENRISNYSDNIIFCKYVPKKLTEQEDKK